MLGKLNQPIFTAAGLNFDLGHALILAVLIFVIVRK